MSWECGIDVSFLLQLWLIHKAVLISAYIKQYNVFLTFTLDLNFTHNKFFMARFLFLLQLV